MESLELTTISSASAIKAEIAPLQNRHRQRQKRCKRLPGAAWTISLFLVAAIIFFMVGFRETNSEEKGKSLSGSQQSTTDGDNGKVDEDSGTSSSGSACDNLYECQTDRMGHETPLYAGQALCNDNFRFGVTPDGTFQWHDCSAEVAKVVFDPNNNNLNTTTDIVAVSYFSMSPQGTLRLMDDQDQIIWAKESTVTITYTNECLHRPLLDCPYLHLHKSGDVVLNSINAQTGLWSARKLERAFDDLYH
jgi:hypothetical protein